MVGLGTFDDRYQAIVGASGEAVVSFGPANNVQWTLTQVSVEMENAPSGAVCMLRKQGAFVTFLIATGDAAGGDPPLPMRGGEVATVEWSACTPGDIGSVYIIYEKATY